MSLPDGHRHCHFGDIDSTNTEAMRQAAAGAEGPLWVTADRQLKGKGRGGRSWASDTGNLYASYLTSVQTATRNLVQLPLVAGVAVYDAITKSVGSNVKYLAIKWPNDLLVGEEKIAGILVESIAGDPAGDRFTIIIGIGINLTTHPLDRSRTATDLAAQGYRIPRTAILETLAPALAYWLDIWQTEGGFAEVRQAWLDRSIDAGQLITVHGPDGSCSGTFQGIDEHGALQLLGDAGVIELIHFGDVSLIPDMKQHSSGNPYD